MLRCALLAYVGVLTSTLAGSLAVWLGGQPMRSLTRHLLGLRLVPAPAATDQLGHILGLAAHNIPIASWPLLLGVAGAERHRLSKRLADCLVLACILLNTALVGAALAAYGRALIPYVPQLPLEWAGIALGVGAWLVQRQRTVASRERLRWFGVIAAVLLCAAAVEAIASPHRGARGNDHGRMAHVNAALGISDRLDSCSRQTGAMQVNLHQHTQFAGLAWRKGHAATAAEQMEINEHGRSRLATARIAQDCS